MEDLVYRIALTHPSHTNLSRMELRMENATTSPQPGVESA